MTPENNEPNRQDLMKLARLLREQRPRPSRLTLDALKQRALKSSGSGSERRRALPARTRLVAFAVFVLALAVTGPSAAGTAINTITGGKSPLSVTPPSPVKLAPGLLPSGGGGAGGGAGGGGGGAYLISSVKSSVGSNSKSNPCKDDKYGRRSYYCSSNNQSNNSKNCKSDRYGISWYYCKDKPPCERDRHSRNSYSGNDWYYCHDNDHDEWDCRGGSRMSTFGGHHCFPCKPRMATKSGGYGSHDPCKPCKDPKGQFPDHHQYCKKDDKPDHCKDDKYGNAWWYCHKPDNCKNDKYGNAWWYCRDDDDDDCDGRHRISTYGGRGDDDCRDNDDHGCKSGNSRGSSYGSSHCKPGGGKGGGGYW